MISAPSERVSSLWLIGPLALALVATVAGVVVGGEPRRIGSIGVELGPLVLLCAPAQLAPWHTWGRIAGCLWFAALLVAVTLAAVGVTFSALPGFNEQPMAADTLLTLVGMLGGAALVLVLTTVGLRRGTWVSVGRRLGATIDAHNLGHAQGVAGTLVWIVVACAPLVVLHGQPPLLGAVASSAIADDRSDVGQSFDLVYELLWLIPVAVVGAGYPLRRGFRSTLSRLGIGRLGRGQLVRVFAVGLALVGLGLLVGAATDALWTWFGWPTTDGELVRRLFGAPIASPLGILIVGLSAGIGEELVTRGLLQPRLGWLLPNLAFAAAHAFQYGADGIVVVFVIGCVQAYVRHRWNTTAAIITHATYDIVLLVIALVQTSVAT